MEQRVWIKSGIVEALDIRQVALLALVLDRIQHYYRDLHRTQPRYRYPLSLSRLAKLCNRSNGAVTLALRYLANTVPFGSNQAPAVFYDRISSQKNKSHRPYRIFLRSRTDYM